MNKLYTITFFIAGIVIISWKTLLFFSRGRKYRKLDWLWFNQYSIINSATNKSKETKQFSNILSIAFLILSVVYLFLMYLQTLER